MIIKKIKMFKKTISEQKNLIEELESEIVHLKNTNIFLEEQLAEQEQKIEKEILTYKPTRDIDELIIAWQVLRSLNLLPEGMDGLKIVCDVYYSKFKQKNPDKSMELLSHKELADIIDREFVFSKDDSSKIKRAEYKRLAYQLLQNAIEKLEESRR